MGEFPAFAGLVAFHLAPLLPRLPDEIPNPNPPLLPLRLYAETPSPPPLFTPRFAPWSRPRWEKLPNASTHHDMLICPLLALEQFPFAHSPADSNERLSNL